MAEIEFYYKKCCDGLAEWKQKIERQTAQIQSVEQKRAGLNGQYEALEKKMREQVEKSSAVYSGWMSKVKDFADVSKVQAEKVDRLPSTGSLQDLYYLIDSAHHNRMNPDRSAVKIIALCKGAIAYLNSEMERRLAAEKEKNLAAGSNLTQEIDRLETAKKTAIEDAVRFLRGPDMAKLLFDIRSSSGNAGYIERDFVICQEIPQSKYPPYLTEYWSKNKIRIPKEEQTATKTVVLCPREYAEKSDRILASYICGKLSEKPVEGRVLILPDRHTLGDISFISSLERYIDGQNIILPNNAQAAKNEIDRMDRLAAEINNGRLMVLRFYNGENLYDSRLKESIVHICNNASKLGISVLVQYLTDGKNSISLPESLKDADIIEYNGNAWTICSNGKKQNYAPPKPLSEYQIAAVKPFTEDASGKEFFKNCPLPAMPDYQAGLGRERISVPFGFNMYGKKVELTLGGDNSFAYICAGTGAGKSSLIHMIIAGILSNYHPDDVELWLADFKKSEMKIYCDSPAPHFRYILLDDSPSYCFEFMERLHNEYIKRKNLFAINKWTDITNVPSNVYMPSVLVLIDEFDVISEAIADTKYAAYLTEILSKGRQFGFRMLMSSQYYSRMTGLEPKARGNMSVRLGMKTVRDSKSDDVGDLLYSVSDRPEVKSVMQNFPRFTSIYSYNSRSGTGVEVVSHFVFQTNDGDKERISDWISGMSLRPYERDNSPKIGSRYERYSYRYVSKNPVFITGLAAKTMQDVLPDFKDTVEKYNRSILADPDSILALPGASATFHGASVVTFQRYRKQNMLFIADYRALSISDIENLQNITSVLTGICLSASLPGTGSGPERKLWFPNQRDYAFKYALANIPEVTKLSVLADASLLRKEIHALKKAVESGTAKNTMVVVADLLSVLDELEAAEENDGNASSQVTSENSYPNDSKRIEECRKILQMKKEGKISEEEFKKLIEQQKKAFSVSKQTDTGMSDDSVEEKYEVLKDFAYLISKGPAQGVHFVLNLSKYGECKETDTTLGNRCIRAENFTHILALPLNTEGGAADYAELPPFLSKSTGKYPENAVLYTDGDNNSVFIPFG